MKQQQRFNYTTEEYREAVAQGVRRGWLTFKPDNAPEMVMNYRFLLGDIPKGINTPTQPLTKETQPIGGL